jgi:hypothetical protein
MNRAIKIVFLFVVSILFSCEKFREFPGCNDCLDTEPSRAQLKFKIESSYGVAVELKVYEGELSDSILIYTQTLTYYYPDFKINVALNKKFSATGKYVINKISYTVIDAAIPKVVYEKDRCDDPCYYIYGNTIDLRLKKTY